MEFRPPRISHLASGRSRLLPFTFLPLTVLTMIGVAALGAAGSSEARALHGKASQDPEAAPTAPKVDNTGAGKKAYSSCVGCHGRPDSKLETDQLWIDRVRVTACVQPLGRPSAATRASILSYLKSDLDVPELVSSEKAPSENEGTIHLGHPEKLTLLLVPVSADGSREDTDRQPIRLAWDTDQGEEKRALPAGAYRVRRYSIRRNDQSGEEWHLWGSGPNGRRVEVSAGKSAKVLLDPRVRCQLTAKLTTNGVGIGLAVTGDGGLGATVMQKDKRVPVKYRLLGDGVVGKGVLPYG